MDADTQRDPRTNRDGRPATGVGQLRLLDLHDRPEWRLDPVTREVGRRGVEAARAALRSARRPGGDDPGQAHSASTAA